MTKTPSIAKDKIKAKTKAKLKSKAKSKSSAKAKVPIKAKTKKKVKSKAKRTRMDTKKVIAKASIGDKRLGNEFWLARSKSGPDKIFSSPEDLLEAAYEYFQWIADNPLTENNAVHHQGSQVDLVTSKLYAPTLAGLWVFIGIGKDTWYRYKNDESREDIQEVIERIGNIMYSHKFSGAAAGLFNANIIARDLGLKDANTHEHTGAGGGPIKAITSEMTVEEASAAYRDMVSE